MLENRKYSIFFMNLLIKKDLKKNNQIQCEHTLDRFRDPNKFKYADIFVLSLKPIQKKTLFLLFLC